MPFNTDEHDLGRPRIGVQPLQAGLFSAAVLLAAFAPQATWAGPGDEVPFSVTNLYFELNDTDGDLGFHGLIDGEAWRRLEIKAPNGRKVATVRLRRSLAEQGLTEFFYESAEPPFDELAPEVFFDRFPEGEYEVSGETIEGQKLEGTAVLTQVMAAPAENIQANGVPTPLDCETEIPPMVMGPVVISWDPVTDSHPDIGISDPMIEIVAYELTVQREDPTSLSYKIDLPPSETSVQVPPEFLALGSEFKIGVLVREASGNQTTVESCFAL